MMKWINDSGIYFPTTGEITFLDTPGKGVFQVTPSSNPMDKRLGLRKVSDKFEFDFKIYDVGCEEVGERIKKVWNSQEYNKNLGVIFTGTKGTGKTLKSKILCNELDLPVILVDNDFEGQILPFITNLNFECVIFLDEAEKTFRNNQEILLKLIDGAFNQTRKLYLLTTNTLSIDPNLIDRPGRIRYVQEFGNLTAKAISECIDDNLKNLEYKQLIIDLIDRLEFSTIDILKNIIEEVNILGPDSIVSELENLNIPVAKYTFDVTAFTGLNPADYKKIFEIAEEIKDKCEGGKDMTVQQFLKGFLKDEDGDWDGGCDIVARHIPDVKYSRDLNIRVSAPELTKGLKTDCGIVLEVFEDGLFTFLQNGWDDIQVCYIKDKRKPHSLYSVL